MLVPSPIGCGRRQVTPYCTIALFPAASFVVFFCFHSLMSKLWQARFFTTVNQLRDLPAHAGAGNRLRRPLQRGQVDGHQHPDQPEGPGLRVQDAGPHPAHQLSFRSAAPTWPCTARTRPGSTRSARLLVDLPGYGYAEVSGDAKLHWQKLLGDYVQRREQLAALVLIMDSRRPFTDLDIQMLEWFAPTGKPIHCILTKVDKLNRNEATNALRQAQPDAGQLCRRGRQWLPVHRAAVLGAEARRHRRSQRQDHRTARPGPGRRRTRTTGADAARPTSRRTPPRNRHADHHAIAIPRHPHAPHAPRRVLARADAREHASPRPT